MACRPAASALVGKSSACISPRALFAPTEKVNTSSARRVSIAHGLEPEDAEQMVTLLAHAPNARQATVGVKDFGRGLDVPRVQHAIESN